jgi:hypothetical protein
MPLYAYLRGGLFPLGLPTKSVNAFLPDAMRDACPAILILLHLISSIKLGENT